MTSNIGEREKGDDEVFQALMFRSKTIRIINHDHFSISSIFFAFRTNFMLHGVNYQSLIYLPFLVEPISKCSFGAVSILLRRTSVGFDNLLSQNASIPHLHCFHHLAFKVVPIHPEINLASANLVEEKYLSILIEIDAFSLPACK